MEKQIKCNFFYLSLDEDFLMLSIVKIHNELIFIYSLFVHTLFRLEKTTQRLRASQDRI